MRNVKNIKDFMRVVRGARIKYRKRKCFFNFLKENIKVSKEKSFVSLVRM